MQVRRTVGREMPVAATPVDPRQTVAGTVAKIAARIAGT